MPEFTREQLEELSDLIYGFFIQKMSLDPEMAASIKVEFKYEPQLRTAEGSEDSSCLDEALFRASSTVASLNCVRGVGFGCSQIPGYRLG